MVVRALDDRCAGAAEDDRWIALELHLIDEDARARFEKTLQRSSLADGVLREQLKAELQAVRNDALVLADAHGDAENLASACHVDGDSHDAFCEAELMHQDALMVGASAESRRSTTVTASGIAFATGSLSS